MDFLRKKSMDFWSSSWNTSSHHSACETGTQINIQLSPASLLSRWNRPSQVILIWPVIDWWKAGAWRYCEENKKKEMHLFCFLILTSKVHRHGWILEHLEILKPLCKTVPCLSEVYFWERLNSFILLYYSFCFFQTPTSLLLLVWMCWW